MPSDTTVAAKSKCSGRDRKEADCKSETSDDTSRVETVDRGVGPTPHPPPPTSHPRTPPGPPYYGVPPYTSDPRNGLLDHHLGYSLPFPPLPYPLNQPLPVNSQTNEGRYHWPPPHLAAAYHQPSHGLPTSPSYSEISQLTLRSPLSSEPITEFANRIRWEHYQRAAMHYSPLPHRGYSPAGLGGYPYPTYLPHPPAHMPSMVHSQRSMFSEHPAPPSASITLPGSVESSRINSPRPSVSGKNSRKRALSHSPFSEYGLDIEGLTRSSEGSLHLAPFAHTNSRSSSAASGSYGHLSAASLAAASPSLSNPHHPLLRHHAGMPPASPLYPPMVNHPLFSHHSSQSTMLPPSQPPPHMLTHIKNEPQMPSTTIKEPSSSVVSSTVENDSHRHRHHNDDSSGSSRHRSILGGGESKHAHHTHSKMHTTSANTMDLPQEGEPDFVETNCHWVDCCEEYETQDELVRHINQDHIAANKKLFVCRWTECNREEKPFKAQYMLVVHMRRHTGEKPHRCTFEGCNKAYSRLENLKTHLRSHTGEKPYTCEYPGCTKAFSNASDRAKHQNRTHSNAKPYICRAPGCTKRYTDPSSLRKHVKTVHGPEFYANKKHKGDSSGDDGRPDKDDKDDSSGGVPQDGCLNSNMSAGSPGDKEAVGSGGGRKGEVPVAAQGSPASVNSCSTNDGQDLADHTRAGQWMASSVGGGSLGEEEMEADDEGEEIALPASSGPGTLLRHNHRMAPNRFKGRIQSKNAALQPLPTLPPIGNTRKVGQNAPGMTDIGNQRSNQKRMNEYISMNARDTLGSSFSSGRRDSNASTLSSYMSSVLSDASPVPFNGRQSSECSRLSITNSPYEYDMPHQSSEMGSIGNMTAQMQKTNLGTRHSASLAHPSSRMSQASNCGSTPARTPQPHENRNTRRASDPIRMDNGQLKELQRFHSLNSMKASPIPRLRKRNDSNQFMSSRSSIATDFSESDLHSEILRDSAEEGMDDDMLIPDEVQAFLENCEPGDSQLADSTVSDTGRSPGHISSVHGQPSPCAQASPGAPMPSPRAPAPSPCGPSPCFAQQGQTSQPRSMQPSPCAQQPSPCALQTSMQPSPCAQQPSPYAQQPSPCAQQPSPCAQQSSPCAQQPSPYAQQPSPCAQQPSPCAQQPSPCAQQTQQSPRAQPPSPYAQQQSPCVQQSPVPLSARSKQQSPLTSQMSMQKSPCAQPMTMQANPHAHNSRVPNSCVQSPSTQAAIGAPQHSPQGRQYGSNNSTHANPSVQQLDANGQNMGPHMMRMDRQQQPGVCNTGQPCQSPRSVQSSMPGTYNQGPNTWTGQAQVKTNRMPPSCQHDGSNRGMAQPNAMPSNMAYMDMNQAMAMTNMIPPYSPHNGYPPYHGQHQSQGMNTGSGQHYGPMNPHNSRGYGPQHVADYNQQYCSPGMATSGEYKEERQSPMVQVPHISQSAVAAGNKMSRQMHRQQQLQRHGQHTGPPVHPSQQQQAMYGPRPAATMPQMQPNPQYQQQYMAGPVPHENGQPLGMPQMPQANVPGPGYQRGNVGPQPHMNMAAGVNPAMAAYNSMPPPVAPPPNVQSPVQRPSCRHSGVVTVKTEAGVGHQMSPGCNQVSSTTDMKACQTEVPPQFEDITALNSVSTENLFDQLSTLSPDTLQGGSGRLLSPTQLVRANATGSQSSSRLETPYMEGKSTSHSTSSYLESTSNMVVNDMSSVLSHLAEENRCLGGR